MKRLVSSIKNLTLLGLAMMAIIMCASVAPAKAAENPYGKTTEERAQELLNAAANYGLIDTNDLSEFKPGKAATYSFVAKTMYRAYMLRNAGCATMKAPSTKKAMNWLREFYITSMLEDPTQEGLLVDGFYDGKGMSFRSRQKANWSWIETALVMVFVGHTQEGPVYEEWMGNHILESVIGWEEFMLDDGISRIQALNIIIAILRPDIPVGNDPVEPNISIGAPCPPVEDDLELLGPAIMMTDSGEVYENGVFIGVYNSETDSYVNIGEPPIVQ